LQEEHAFDGLELQDVQRDDHAVQLTRSRAVGRELAPQVLAPGAWRGAQVHHHLARLDEPQRLVDLLQLVGGPRAVAVLLRHLDVGIVDVVVEPRLVDLLAFAGDLHSRSIIRA
jgi:hypothetical protein